MSTEIAKDDRILVDGELVSVAAVTATPLGFECIVKSPTRGLFEVFIRPSEVAAHKLAASDGSGDSSRAITAVWAQWMGWAIPRIRSAVLATRPLKPYAHQDDAVFGVMLSQPRLRFLLADEPGTGKTLMTGMYIAEARRRDLVPGRVVIVVPAHLVEKWIRELQRFLGIDAYRITAEIGRDPLDLRGDVDVWVVSVDLYTYNPDVRRKVEGSRASWSLAVFDEAHRLPLPRMMPNQVQVGFDGPARYGVVMPDGRTEAFVPIWCDNGGGTAGGQLGQSLVVFHGAPGEPAVTGIITTSQANDHTMAYFDNSATRIETGRITLEELFYGPDDSTCCPTGRAEDIWTVDGATLVQSESHVTRQPDP